MRRVLAIALVAAAAAAAAAAEESCDEDGGAAGVGDVQLVDHQGQDLESIGGLDEYRARCQSALKRAAAREQNASVTPLQPESLETVRVSDRAAFGDPRVVYFVTCSSKTCAITVSRLLLALYHTSQVFIVHVEAKTDESVLRQLKDLTVNHQNVHIVKNRRTVQWGGWSSVLPMLDALASLETSGFDFDFFINLSEYDLALRTNQEVVAFLRQYMGRQFVHMHAITDAVGPGDAVATWEQPPAGPWSHSVRAEDILDTSRAFANGHAVVECDGDGFVVLGGDGADEVRAGKRAGFRVGSDAVVRFGRSGRVSWSPKPTVNLTEFGEVSAIDAKLDASRSPIRSGSHWAILSRLFALWMVGSPEAMRWRRIFEQRLMPDEAFVQTALWNSPFNRTAVHTNLRWIWWPHNDGDPAAYWDRLGAPYAGGPTVLTASKMNAVFRSPHMFARKVDPNIDSDAIRLWDEWMARKIAGEHPAEQQSLGHSSARWRGEARRGVGTPAGMPMPQAVGEETKAAGVLPDDHAPLAETAAHGAAATLEDLSARPVRAWPPRRAVTTIQFDDGSSCTCGLPCDQSGDGGGCCDDWRELCPDASELSHIAPPCPPPPDTPLASIEATDDTIALSRTFVNHARWPVKLLYVDADGRVSEMGTVDAGRAVTFTTAYTHAWRVISFSGVTVLEIPATNMTGAAAGRVTVDIPECDLDAAPKLLHQGWQS